jgi:threonylcarbamoyladenosine tRNA methylthiotransferase MtaB
VEDILGECRRALADGARELVVTGTHIGCFGDGRGGGLSTLLEQLVALEGDYRVRLSSLEPGDLSEQLLELVCGHPRVCPHLHVSVQSLCADTLRSMNRRADGLDRLVGRLAALRARHDSLALGGDFIVGFPGETHEHFTVTLRNAQRASFTHGHVFGYSKRPGTSASAMPRQVDGTEKARRNRLLRDLIAHQHLAFLRSQAGRRHRVVVERTAPARGLTGNYIRVVAEGAQSGRNEWLDVQLSGVHDGPRPFCTARPL